MILASETVVVTANAFNPSITSQLWLAQNGVVEPDEFTADSLFTPPLVQFAASRFGFLLTAERLQVTPFGTDDEKAEVVRDRIAKLVRTLPHTPFRGIGINFVWHLPVIGAESLQQVSRRLFLKGDGPLAARLSDATAAFGAYFSVEWQGFRLKLNALPGHSELTDESNQPVILLSFNYHRDLSTADQVCDMLTKWKQAKEHSLEYVKAIERAM